MNSRILFILVISGLLYCGVGSAATHTCSSCSDCNNKINSASAGDIIYLTTNITNQSGTCIAFTGTERIALDCQGNRIEGNSSGDYGIYLNDSLDNTITNCRVSLFGYGIYLYSSNTNTITNNTANNNSYEGIKLFSSNNNTLIQNTVNNNYQGITCYHSDNNTITGNTVNNNPWGGILFISSNTNTLTGNTANNNLWYGIYFSLSCNNSLIQNTANNNSGDGICIYYFSDNNALIQNTANYNEDYGIHLSSSNTLTMNLNHACSNTVSDFYLSSSSGNSGDDNTCDNPDGWSDEGTSGCTYSCGGVTTTTTTSTSTTTSTTIPAECDLSGDYPPCGEVTLSEVVDFINQWAQGQALLADVIDLINAWASG